MNDSPRIGLGIDLHRLVKGRRCMLGGVEVPSPVGPHGHSDGDVVLHATCDAVLGAAGLDDLGSLFPDDDNTHRDRASAEFCTEVLRRVRARDLRVRSLDIVVECEQPRLRAYRDAMRDRIATLFAVDRDRVNVKGKSGEGQDAIGAGAAIRATAVALLSRA